jgi:hypothetical protein
MKSWIRVSLLSSVAAWLTVSCASTVPIGQTPASTSLTWNRVAMEAVERAKPSQHQAVRLYANVSLAQYAAMAEAKNEDAARDAVAMASMRVIAALLPTQAAFIEERHRQLQMRDSEIGRRVAERVVAQAQTDRFAEPWKGQLPQEANAWRSLVNPPAPPAHPGIGAMRTFVIDSGSAFRPAPPPQMTGARFQADLAEVKRYTSAPTEQSTQMAKFYDMTTGTLAGGYWNEQATELIRKGGTSEHQATVILSTVNAAMLDALAACHDAKYAYWVPRPSQIDPSIKPIIGVPNHPAYPSNHSCLSTAAGIVLAHFFPQERARLEKSAADAGLSRLYAGLHYRFDVEAGEEIGRKVAGVAIARHSDMLARYGKTMVSKF